MSNWTRAYDPPRDIFDEAFTASGTPRAEYEPVLEAMAGREPGELAGVVASALAREGVRFRTGRGVQPFAVDPLPRLFSGEEWRGLERGLIQRCEALNAFIADAYGERMIVTAGVVPDRVIEDSSLYEPMLRGIPVPNGVYAHVCGPDLVRDPSGELRVLEDNVRSPSGLAYVLAARRVLMRELGAGALGARPLGPAIGAMADALGAAAAPEVSQPHVVLLSDGPDSPAWFEHRDLASRLDIPVVAPAEMSSRDGKLWLVPERGARRQVDVVYRRTGEDNLTGANGVLTAVGELLWEPIRAGTVAVVNAFGTGIADDKLSHAYVEEMIRFYLEEEPLLRSVPTLDLCDPEERAAALRHLDDMVIKRRSGLGGDGVTICSDAGRRVIEGVLAAVREDPADFVAQERISLSTHPTFDGEHLEPRHVDLRPYVLRTAAGYRVVPGGLTRFAARRGSLVVNSSQGGGGKDTWVLE